LTAVNAAGRAPDGREIGLPGLGAISGDWGGGSALGLEMVRAIMRAWDGRGKPTLLTRGVLAHYGVPDEAAEFHDPWGVLKTWAPQYDWGYVSEPVPGLNGRRIPITRGKVLGSAGSPRRQ
jgi:hypothetical protein